MQYWIWKNATGSILFRVDDAQTEAVPIATKWNGFYSKWTDLRRQKIQRDLTEFLEDPRTVRISQEEAVAIVLQKE